MTINYQSFSFAQNATDTSGSSLTPSAPSGTVAGNLLVSFLATGSPAGTTTLTAPAGWTVAIEDETNGSSTCHNQIAYKIATGSDDFTFTYTATTAKARVEIYRFSGDFNASNPISVIGAYFKASAQNFVAPSVTSIADNSKLLSFCCTKNAVLAAENSATPPTGMTLIHSTNIGTTFSPAKMAIAEQDIATVSATGTRTWSAFDSSNRYGDAVNILINGLAITIDTINGDSSNPDIDVTASNTATTTGLGTVTACTFTDSSGFVSTATPSMPSGDGSFVFAWPWADGSQQAKFGSVTASMTDGTLTATLPSNMPLPATYSSTTWSGATDLGEFYLGHYLTLTNDNRVYYPTVVDGVTVTINPDGWMSFSSLPVTVPLLLHDCRSGGTGVITTKTLYVTSGGAVIVGGGLTSSGLTSSGLTSSGLTSSGL